MKRIIILLTALAVVMMVTPVLAGSTQDIMLQRLAANTGFGKLTWNNVTPISVTYNSTDYADTATLACSTDEVFTIASSYGGTSPMMNITISAGAVTAVTGTITWSSADLLTVELNSGSAQAKTTDCTGITLTACITAANALTYTGGHEFVATAGVGLPDASYTDYYEPEAASDLAATALTAAAGGTKTQAIAMATATLHDTAALDCTGKSFDACEALFDALWGGDVHTWVTADGVNSDLANGFNDVADLGATDYTTALGIPMTAGGAAVDYLEEDRFKSLGYLVVDCNFTTACNVRVCDGDTVIWESAALVDNTRTEYDFYPMMSATGSNQLKVQLYSGDTIADTTYMYAVGSIY